MSHLESNTTTERLIYCSFCGRNQYQFDTLFETNGAAICNFCVCVCCEKLAELQSKEQS